MVPNYNNHLFVSLSLEIKLLIRQLHTLFVTIFINSTAFHQGQLAFDFHLRQDLHTYFLFFFVLKSLQVNWPHGMYQYLITAIHFFPQCPIQSLMSDTVLRASHRENWPHSTKQNRCSVFINNLPLLDHARHELLQHRERNYEFPHNSSIVLINISFYYGLPSYIDKH